MNNEITDLNTEEIEMITGAGEVNSPVEVTNPDDYPIIINNPP